MDNTPTTKTDSSFEFGELTVEDSATIVPLANKLHPEMDPETFRGHLEEMFKYPTYRCLGLWLDGKLVAVTNGWITVRFYSGKQLEVDNVIVDPDLRSKGVGKHFFACIDQWARQNNCNTIELNTYVQNSKSHKFYFNEGYAILGFHFQKVLSLFLLTVCLSSTLPAFSQRSRLTITHLTGNVYVYTTWRTLPDGPYPANSAYLVTARGVVMLDCPWDTTQYQPLLDSIEVRHHQRVVLFIATHFHDDRTCAIDFLKKKGIPTYSTTLTQQLCLQHHNPQAEYIFMHDTSFHVGGYTIQTYYPGPGHTPDNIVVWLGRDKVLYGGCLVKSTEAAGLGNLEDANITEWPASIHRVIDRYPNALYVIPGHLGWTDPHSLQHTLDLLKQ